MNRNRTMGVALVLAAAVAASVAVVAFAGAGGNATPATGDTPTQTAPAATPQPTPAPTSQPQPSAPADPTDPTPASPLKVTLDTADGHQVTVQIVDRTGHVDGASSGQPGDGMSVEPWTVLVRNLDSLTLELTWVDFGIDNDDTLFVFEESGVLRLVLIQPEATTDTDAIGFDRVLRLAFDRAVSAGQVVATLQDGLDTPGD